MLRTDPYKPSSHVLYNVDKLANESPLEKPVS
jgi:hypothetical protein